MSSTEQLDAKGEKKVRKPANRSEALSAVLAAVGFERSLNGPLQQLMEFLTSEELSVFQAIAKRREMVAEWVQSLWVTERQDYREEVQAYVKN